MLAGVLGAAHWSLLGADGWCRGDVGGRRGGVDGLGEILLLLF